MLTAEQCRTYKRFVDEDRWYLFPMLGANIARMYGRQGGRIVDMGTGPGYLSAQLALRTGAMVHAVDINPAMLELARAHVSDAAVTELVTFEQADVHHLPLPTEFADVVVSFSCLHHWVDPVRGLSECYRILAPGGLLLIIDNAAAPKEALTVLERTVSQPIYLDIVKKAFRESYDLEQVSQLAQQAALPNFKLTPFRFSLEDLADCIDTFDRDLPETEGVDATGALTWLLEVRKP